MSARGHVFLAPDNGLLARLVRRHEVEGMVRLKDAALKNLGIDRPSATFHGRDIFAPVAAEIVGRLAFIFSFHPLLVRSNDSAIEAVRWLRGHPKPHRLAGP